MNSEIEKVRIKAFEEFLQDRDSYYAYINKSFRVLSSCCTEDFIAESCLKLFEFILYSNYVTGKILLTKCDIDKRLYRVNSKYSLVARKLLSSLYNTRNNYAHGNYNTLIFITGIRQALNSINSMSEFKSIMRLLIPVNYPTNINNFYFIIDRAEPNEELVSLQQGIKMLYSNSEIESEQRNIGAVYNAFSDDYNQSALSSVILQTLAPYYRVM